MAVDFMMRPADVLSIYGTTPMRLALAALALAVASPAGAAPRCMARIVMDVGADGSSGSVMHKGGALFGPIKTVVVDRKSGRTSYCAHGPSCYSTGAMDIITPCRFEQSIFSDNEDIYLTAK